MAEPLDTLAYAAPTRESRQSRWGIVSLGCSLGMIASVAFGAIMFLTVGLYRGSDVLPLWLLGSLAGTFLFATAAFITGVIGILQTRRRRGAAIASLAAVAALCIFILCWVGA